MAHDIESSVMYILRSQRGKSITIEAIRFNIAALGGAWVSTRGIKAAVRNLRESGEWITESRVKPYGIKLVKSYRELKPTHDIWKRIIRSYATMIRRQIKRHPNGQIPIGGR